MSTFIKLLLVAGAAYAALLAVMFYLQRSLIYFPDTQALFVPDPAYRLVQYQAADGISLQALYAPPQKPENPVLIYFHGNAGNAAGRAAKAEFFRDLGFGILLAEYRGYGGNAGTPSENGLYADARAAVDFIRQEAPQSPHLFYGESLGTAVAVATAVSARPPAALILEAPFTSLFALARQHYPWVPAALLLKDRYETDAMIRQYAGALFVFYGERDEVVPSAMSVEVFNLSPSGLKDIHKIFGAMHNDLTPAHVSAQLLQFLDDAELLAPEEAGENSAQEE